jgi:hypothetical protein
VTLLSRFGFTEDQGTFTESREKDLDSGNTGFPSDYGNCARTDKSRWR